MRQNKASNVQQQVEIIQKKNAKVVTKKPFENQNKSLVVTDKSIEFKKKKMNHRLRNKL